ncbi:MAG: hypothetical protein ACREDO_13965 [Methyloceanibacter sp.]
MKVEIVIGDGKNQATLFKAVGHDTEDQIRACAGLRQKREQDLGGGGSPGNRKTGAKVLLPPST